MILAESVPAEQRGDLRRLVNRHIEQAVTHEWGVMAQRRVTMETCRPISSMRKVALALQPADETQRMVQREIINDVHRALEARRQRIVVSQTSVSVVKWAAILLQGLRHGDRRLGLADCRLQPPLHRRISVGPQLLQQVIATEPPDTSP